MLNQDNNYYWGEWVTGLTRKKKVYEGDLDDYADLVER